jgi:hypothetical protein
MNTADRNLPAIRVHGPRIKPGMTMLAVSSQASGARHSKLRGGALQARGLRALVSKGREA